MRFEKAHIIITTITKIGKDCMVIFSDVSVKVCAAVKYNMDDTVESISGEL